MAKASKKIGRPSKRTPEIIDRVLDGLRSGTPLTVICREEGMPDDDTIRRWAEKDDDLLRAIARARDTGHDVIAMEALAIADDAANDTIKTEHGDKPNSEWITRSRLRVDTRLKLLAKWNPKRYGDRIDVTSGGEKIQREAGETEKFSRLAALMEEKRNAGLLPDFSGGED